MILSGSHLCHVRDHSPWYPESEPWGQCTPVVCIQMTWYSFGGTSTDQRFSWEEPCLDANRDADPVTPNSFNPTLVLSYQFRPCGVRLAVGFFFAATISGALRFLVALRDSVFLSVSPCVCFFEDSSHEAAATPTFSPCLEMAVVVVSFF